MKYCIAIGQTTSPTTPLLLEGDFVKSMETARELGYHAVEIHVPDPEVLDPQKIKEACDHLGMFVATLGTGQIYGKYGLHLMDENEENQAKLRKMVGDYIDIAAKIGSKATIGSIKGNYPKDGDKAKYLEIMGKSLKKISDYATQKGVTILLEATNHFENNALNTGKDVFTMIETYQLSAMEILMDSFHINMEERDLAHCLADAGSLLGHIHFSDNTRWYPGSGAFNFDVFCQSIKEVGYDGVLSVECFPIPDGLTAARETIAFFQKYFG